jgi:hypothetical protein
VTDFDKVGNTAKKVQKSLILLPNINQTVWRVQYVHRNLRTISLNDIERERSQDSMVVGVVQINFNLWLVWQLMPTVDRGMGVWGTWGRHQFIE